MKRLIPAIVLALSVIAAPAHADQATAVAAVKKLSRVVDASVDKGGNMYVLVKAESISWDQYATYLCKVVIPHKARIFRVRIIELTKAIRTQPEIKWDRLGEASCGD